MQIYLMIPFDIIVRNEGASLHEGSITLDYDIFFNATGKYKFKKALLEPNNYKPANLSLPNCHVWRYTIIDPGTFDRC